MAWTSEQTVAIYERGKNIIVSAGAGSGKTAVLSERILEYCKAGGDIRKILVLTFTNKAAQEMKERIRNKLIENNLIEQSELIDASYITTFDSYSLSLVKRYYYILGLNEDIGLLDQSFLTVKLKEIVDEIFAIMYESEDSLFLSFLDAYLRKNDEDFRSLVIDICNNIELVIDEDNYYKNYIENYFGETKLSEIAHDFTILQNEAVSDYVASLNELYEWIANEPKQDKLMNAIEELIKNLNEAKTSDDIKIILATKLPNLARGSTAQDLKKAAKEKCSLALDLYMYNPLDIKNDILKTKDFSCLLLNLAKEAISRLNSFKRSVNRYSFSDIAKLAIKLVKENETVRNELKYYYDEILVDEYQDTSDLQETFLLEIENNNRYMVGDIKQSIYRFRNANPYIFKNKYDRYQNNDGGMKIDLTYNFRSRNEVVNNINLLFNELMTNDFGDANYKVDHQMRFGQKGYLEVKEKYDFNIECLSYVDDDYDLKTEEIEAFIAAKTIKDIMNQKVLVLGKKGPREVTYDDFAVLISTSTSFQTFKQIFEYLNIPLAIEADLDLKKSALPRLFANILTLILPKKNQALYNHALASLARSFIYSYSDEDIFKLIVKHEHLPILDDIDYFRSLKEIPYTDLFFEITTRLDIYKRLTLIGDMVDSLAAIENVYKMFEMFADLGMTLDMAEEYLVSVMDSDINYKYKVSQNTAGHVRIMTIHASKGLEFPFCIFPMMSKRFNEGDSKKQMGFSCKYGIYLPVSEEGERDTVIRLLNNKKNRDEELSERVRLFYVALTRAREKMIIIRKKTEKEITSIRKIHSYQDMLNYIKVYDSYNKDIDLKDYSLTKAYKSRKLINKIKGDKVLEYEEPLEIASLTKGRISKEMDVILDDEIRRNIELGKTFHMALETIDFNTKSLDDIPVDSFIKNTLKKVLSNPIFSVKPVKFLQEHEFSMIIDGVTYNGVIDLLMIYEDHIDIIDYKLYNTSSKEYKRQLEIYKEYVKQNSKLEVNTYLLSLLNAEVIAI